MKTNFFTLLLLFIGLGLNAQITVTNSILPADGDTLRTRQVATTAISVTAPGPNQTWDYTALTGGTYRQVNVMTNTNTALFANASIEQFDHDFNGQAYYDNTGNTQELVGFSGDFLGIGVAFDVPFQNGTIVLETPLTYQASYVDSTYFQITADLANYPSLDSFIMSFGIPSSLTINQVRITFTDTATHEVDAYGQLTINDFGTMDVLREKEVRISNTIIEINGTFVGFPTGWIDPSTIAGFPPIPFGGLDTVTTYRFYNDNTKEVVVKVTMDSTQMNVENAEYKSPEPPVSTISQMKNAQVKAFPNPVYDQLNLEFTDFTPGQYHVKVFSLIGSLVKQDSFDINSKSERIQLNVSDLHKGSYLYSIVDEDGRTIATKRIMIVKP